MAIRVQRHTNVSKQATLLDGLDVSPLKWRVCGCGLNRFVHEGMNHISNVMVHSKTRSGNVNIKLYHNLLPEWEKYTFLTAKNDWVSRVVPSAYFSISDYQLSSKISSMKLNQQNLLLLNIHFNSCIDFLPDCLVMPQKIHVQIMRFTCCLNMICKHDVTQERVVALTDHYDNAFFAIMLRVSMILWQHNDIQKLEVDTILFREIQHKKMGYLMFKRCFQCSLGLKSSKYGSIIITHHCFIPLILGGP